MASGRSLTSKHNMVKYSFFLWRTSSVAKNGVRTFNKSFLETSPMQTVETGILFYFKKTNNASRDPKLDAATPTPSVDSFINFLTFLISSLRSFENCSSSSLDVYLYNELPAKALSSP